VGVFGRIRKAFPASSLIRRQRSARRTPQRGAVRWDRVISEPQPRGGPARSGVTAPAGPLPPDAGRVRYRYRTLACNHACVSASSPFPAGFPFVEDQLDDPAERAHPLAALLL